jgi:hypothetical protein
MPRNSPDFERLMYLALVLWVGAYLIILVRGADLRIINFRGSIRVDRGDRIRLHCPAHLAGRAAPQELGAVVLASGMRRAVVAWVVALRIYGDVRQFTGPIHFELFDMPVWFAIAATEASAHGLVLCGDTGGWFATAPAVMGHGAWAAAS